MSKIIGILLFFIGIQGFSQEEKIVEKGLLTHISTAQKDTIKFHPVSTNPDSFQISLAIKDRAFAKKTLDTSFYSVDFSRSELVLKPIFYQKYTKRDSLYIIYKTYPSFLTKTYQSYDRGKIFPDMDSIGIMVLATSKKPLQKIPFEGLDTQGSLVRGITVGNNQDAVLNASLDLKISGKLSPKITLDAHINDTNVPVQENGYSQELKDIDRIFMEVNAPDWQLQGGDIILRDSTHYFSKFSKKVQGVSWGINGEKFQFYTSGALVKGQYASQQINGQEHNQGPYKLKGNNGVLHIFLIQGSERVFINGVLQKRGEKHDYEVDYNLGEITFTATHPITSEDRILVEYQYSERQYNRFVTHNTASYVSDKFRLDVSFYKESDFKNQVLDASLSDEQLQEIAEAGTNSGTIYITQVTETSFSPNLILYKKSNTSGIDIYAYSTDPNDILYQVKFTYFGEGLGTYKVVDFLAQGKVMQYVGENMGDYLPVIPLTAPNAYQLFSWKATYKPYEQTNIEFEMATTQNNQNLYATNSSSNYSPAIKSNWKQTLWEKKWKARSELQWDFIHANFKSLERVFQVEFDRDWSILEKSGNQSLVKGLLSFEHPDLGFFSYELQRLQFVDAYKGTKHQIMADMTWDKWKWFQASSLLNNHSNLNRTSFARNTSQVRYGDQKWFTSLDFLWESHLVKQTGPNEFSNQSFRKATEKWTFGMGDTARVHLKTGITFQQNDSIVAQKLARVNHAHTLFLQSQLLAKEQSNLQVFLHYRTLYYNHLKTSNALNSKISYRQDLFEKAITLQSDYQNTSGQIAQQDFTYVQTEPGQGYYTWNDYNENGIQEIDEFDVAVFADQASYLRVSLPNISYLPTQEAKFSQQIIWNPDQKTKKTASFWSKWYNLFSISAQNTKLRTDQKWQLNPFDFNTENVLGHLFQWKNQLMFNRGKSHYTGIYTYGKNSQKTWLYYGSIAQQMRIHQFDFTHEVAHQWVLGFTGFSQLQEIENEGYTQRNYMLQSQAIAPSLTYFFTKKHFLKGRFEVLQKENLQAEKESLNSLKWAFTYQYTSEKDTRFSVDVNLLKNTFDGNSNSAIGYQMLEGLQPGNNVTWNMLWSKKMNSFLFLNLNYNGRANAISRTIHNGNVQLRAQF